MHDQVEQERLEHRLSGDARRLTARWGGPGDAGERLAAALELARRRAGRRFRAGAVAASAAALGGVLAALPWLGIQPPSEQATVGTVAAETPAGTSDHPQHEGALVQELPERWAAADEQPVERSAFPFLVTLGDGDEQRVVAAGVYVPRAAPRPAPMVPEFQRPMVYVDHRGTSGVSRLGPL